ncbi:MAG: BON domain-containing protein [Acidimicrobiales bacterium]
MAAIRFLLTLPFRLLALAILVPVKTALALLAFSLRATFASTRFALRSSLVSFAAGVGLGWFLTATPTGRQLVGQVRDLASGSPGAPVDDDTLAAQVRTQLASSTHTWHLPQPEVTVSNGVVTLVGPVPHDAARSALEAAVMSVKGVVAVVNRVTVGLEESGASGA